MTANEISQRADDSTSEASPAMRALQSAPQSITAERDETNGPVATKDAVLSEILQATASSFTAARAVMETAARTAFAFFADASEADRAALMGELSDTALAHDAIL
ncbi:hypothetical protein, partial [uncultured Agrococcus sp.]|uniref:hypothetical protein n=1 Tax=uncultured Agrococcus sp. TaxID=382258 RepID=UPI0025CCA7EC